MQPSRWTERRGGAAAGTGIAFASRLPLRRYRDIPGFLRDTRTVRAQLREAPGLAGYSLRAQFLRKTFWTLCSGASTRRARTFGERSAPLPSLNHSRCCTSGLSQDTT